MEETLKLSLDPLVMLALKFILALIMLSVSLELSFSDLKYSLKHPKNFAVGVTSQFVLLPFMTYLLVSFFPVAAPWALGMFVVAACPGGNVSNFISLLARANIALSVCLTFASTILALVMTPFNINFWGRLSNKTSDLVQTVNLDVSEVYQTIFFVLGIPLVVGLILAKKNYSWLPLFKKWLNRLALVFLVVLVIGAISKNFKLFIDQFYMMFFIVLIHNGLSFLMGYFTAKSMRLPQRDAKTISIETGIQNAGLGLALGLEFFTNIPEVAIICAWWGVWHIVAGLTLTAIWRAKETHA